MCDDKSLFTKDPAARHSSNCKYGDKQAPVGSQSTLHQCIECEECLAYRVTEKSSAPSYDTCRKALWHLKRLTQFCEFGAAFEVKEGDTAPSRPRIIDDTGMTEDEAQPAPCGIYVALPILDATDKDMVAIGTESMISQLSQIFHKFTPSKVAVIPTVDHGSVMPSYIQMKPRDDVILKSLTPVFLTDEEKMMAGVSKLNTGKKRKSEGGARKKKKKKKTFFYDDEEEEDEEEEGEDIYNYWDTSPLDGNFKSVVVDGDTQVFQIMCNSKNVFGQEVADEFFPDAVQKLTHICPIINKTTRQPMTMEELRKMDTVDTIRTGDGVFSFKRAMDSFPVD